MGEDRTYSLQVDFLDAVFGTSTEIDVRTLRVRVCCSLLLLSSGLRC